MNMDTLSVLVFVMAYVALGFALLSYSLSTLELKKKLVPVQVRSRRR